MNKLFLLQKAEIFRSFLSSCRLCPRHCQVDRLHGQKGYCQSGALTEVAYIGPHFGEEPPISGNRGSGTVFFGHCTLHCVFCQNHQISHPAPNNSVLRTLSDEALADEFLRLQALGVHNLNLVSPTPYLPQILSALCFALERGFSLPIVYNCSGFESLEILKLLDGVVDIYLPDLKYCSPELSFKYSDSSAYPLVAQIALAEMFRQVGHLSTASDNIAYRGLLVRHLAIPGQNEDSKACLNFIKDLSPDMAISLMSQYSPQYQCPAHPELARSLSPEEYQQLIDHANTLDLANCWTQEMESKDVFLPDFKKAFPFEQTD